ncbi:MAG: ATP-dependent acyl-CoA ligase [Deltaproteobacteria bacterium HGW-Deltaproteobacteria-2]|nr:MAG: ATP-dependent acyl-CoA ligase [Deltaproteobacteria bacterium HGW-Deltaproteobacteria-2]
MSDELKDFPLFKSLWLKIKEPDKTALIIVNDDGSDERITYAGLFENTNRISRSLIKAGIGEGDTFAIVMRNHPEFLYSLSAALSLGAMVVPIDPRSKGAKLSFQIKNTKCKGIIVSDEFIGSIKEIENDIRDVPVIGVAYKKHHGIPVNSAYPVLNEILEKESGSLPDKALPMNLKRPVQIIHTSGTTGDPKGVMLRGQRLRDSALLGKIIYKYKNDDILYNGLSMTHGNCQSVTLFPALSKGITAVIGEKFTKSRIWDICRKYGCTSFSSLGGMMAGIYNEPPKPNDADNPVRVVISAGTPAAIWEDFEKRFNVKIHEWYAAVEGGLAHNPPGKGPVGSFGKPNFLMYRMKIVDENDKEVGSFVKGELISKMTFRPTKVDYFGKKKESDEKTKGGWLRSGDICHKDDKGFLFFDFPDYVEKIIGEHESVSEVCVYGVPASSGAPGESDLVAAVAPFSGKKIDVDSLSALCVKKLERNSVPSYFQIVDDIPKTITEKALDRILREQFRPDAPNVVNVQKLISGKSK